MATVMPRENERPVVLMPSSKLDLEIEMVGKCISEAVSGNPALHRRLQAMTFDVGLDHAAAWELTAATHLT